MSLCAGTCALREFELLLGGWRNYLATPDPDMPSTPGFVRAVTECARQLERVIAKVRELEDDDDGSAPVTLWPLYLTGPWQCQACGSDYSGPIRDHLCPVPVKPLTGSIGIYGLDWTYG